MDVFAPPDIAVEHRADGAILVRSRSPLHRCPTTIAHVFRERSELHPNRVLVTEPEDGGRREVTWGDARVQVDAVAQALLDAGLSSGRPLVVLSGNSTFHLLLLLGAHTAGIPIVSVSTAYSLASGDHDRLRAIVALVSPGLVVADDPDAYGPALDAASNVSDAQALAGQNGVSRLLGATPGAGLETAFAALTPEHLAKIVFTSGSTGRPKGVLTTHRMLVSNQQATSQVWAFLQEEPPVLVDWLPWSHSFGGSHNLNQVLFNGGTMHIDVGKPTPALFNRTIAALREHPPTVYYNVPAGYALLADHLETDPELAKTFFSRLRVACFSGAPMPQAVWERMRGLAERYASHEVPLTGSWGMTEMGPGATSTHFWPDRCDCIGVPLPGTTLKLSPMNGRMEVRAKGPNITPGYHRSPEATSASFDEEGYFRSGDAARLVDPEEPNKGLAFDGRLAENFKLTTGTWVNAGDVRTRLLSSLGLIADAVITGHGRSEVGALAWLSAPAAEKACGGLASQEDPRLRDLLAARLAAHNAGAGSASRVARLLLLEEPPRTRGGELTDKGYINQRVVLERCVAQVERLYREPLDKAVITPGAQSS